MNEQPHDTDDPTHAELLMELGNALYTSIAGKHIGTYEPKDLQGVLDSYIVPRREISRLEGSMIEQRIIPVSRQWLAEHEGTMYQVAIGQRGHDLFLCSMGDREMGGIADFQLWRLHV